MSIRLKILQEMKEKLTARIAELEPLMTYNPKSELIKLYTKEFPALLQEYTGSERLSDEFRDKVNALARKEDRLKKEAEGFNAVENGDKVVKELVAAQHELREVEREIYFTQQRP